MDRITVSAVGDVMLGDHPVCFGHGVRSSLRKRGEQYLFANVSNYLQGHDVFFANLECVLSDIGHNESRLSSSELRGDAGSAGLLKVCDRNILSVANNHMLQHGENAFDATKALLEQNGIDAIGVYEDGFSNVIEVTKGSVSIAFIGYSFRPEHFSKNNRSYAAGTPERVLDQIKILKQRSPGTSIVISLHWGEEYLNCPSSAQIELAHALVDAGANLILGHHPHVLQGIERYKEGVIAYSLGNFVFDSWQTPTRESAILSCTFSAEGVAEFEVVPVLIGADYAPIMKTKLSDKISKKIASYSELVKKREGLAKINVEEYSKVAESAYLKYRLQCYSYFVMHIWKYKPAIIFSSLFRALLRRVGLA